MNRRDPGNEVATRKRSLPVARQVGVFPRSTRCDSDDSGSEFLEHVKFEQLPSVLTCAAQLTYDPSSVVSYSIQN